MTENLFRGLECRWCSKNLSRTEQNQLVLRSMHMRVCIHTYSTPVLYFSTMCTDLGYRCTVCVWYRSGTHNAGNMVFTCRMLKDRCEYAAPAVALTLNINILYQEYKLKLNDIHSTEGLVCRKLHSSAIPAPPIGNLLQLP